MKKLEEIIRRYVKLGRSSNKGWHSCVHQGCDHGRKGKRAAFLFLPNGGVKFNCFNCQVKTGFDESIQKVFPKKLIKVFNDFGIPESEWKPLQVEFFVKAPKEMIEESKRIKKIEPRHIELPKYFYFLKYARNSDKWAEVAVEYLKERKIDPDSYRFMLSEKKTDKWYKRLIIPFYKDKKLIFYTGRDLTGKAKKKYENPMMERNNVMFNFDIIFGYNENPIYVVEGVMDALSIPDCVAILSNELTEEQIEWLNKTRREKIYIPDKIKGRAAANKAIELGWSISTPKIGNCNDINDAIVEFGQLYVLKSLKENTRSGDLAKISVGLYCDS